MTRRAWTISWQEFQVMVDQDYIDRKMIRDKIAANVEVQKWDWDQSVTWIS